MTFFAIRVKHPRRYAGDWFTLAQADTRDDYETFRYTLGTPENFEVVEMNDRNEVIS